MTVLAGSAVVLAAGLLLRYPELIGLGAAGAVAVLAALLAVARAPRVQVERVVSPRRVARGAHASARVRVRNDARRRSPAVVARDVAGPVTAPFRSPGCGPGRSTRASRRCPRRGAAWWRAARCWWTGATRFLTYGQTTTSFVVSTPVPPRTLPITG